MTITANESRLYASLQVLEDASDALIASLPEDDSLVSDSERDAISKRISRFIDQATMTGTVLDAPEDRRAAQALVDFWLAKSYAIASEIHTKQRPSARIDTLLRPFDLAAVTATAAEADAALASLSQKDDEKQPYLDQILLRVAPPLSDHAGYQDLARRMLLRTVRMSEDEGTCEPVRVRRYDLVSLGESDRTSEVLEVLVASGVLRVEPDKAGDWISLRCEALTREWDTLQALIAERADFRGAAVFWDQRGRATHALSSAGQANKALADYADLNALERAFIAANSSYTHKKIFALTIACVVALPLVWTASRYLYHTWEEAQVTKAILTIISSGDNRSKEEAIQKLAGFGRSINFQSQPLEDLNLKEMYDRAKSPAVAEFFKSAIVRVKFVDATLRYASFSQCKIYEATFPSAELSSARFDEAIITKSDFSGAILYRAIFDHARFNDVNNFSNTDLRSASFRDVGINGDLIFTGTAWWLAFGWTLPQVEKFSKQYSDIDIKEARIFKADILLRKKEVDNAVSPEDRVRALNELAWTYAIYGADLTAARQAAQKALNEFAAIKTSKGKGEAWITKTRMNLTDTMAYIALQEGEAKEAVRLLEQPEIVESKSDGDLVFRYAFALHALALKETGEEKDRLDQKAGDYLDKSLQNRNYVPSHELYLLRRYITGEFKDQLAARLSKEAN